jgi:hypothetical protein
MPQVSYLGNKDFPTIRWVLEKSLGCKKVDVLKRSKTKQGRKQYHEMYSSVGWVGARAVTEILIDGT